MNQLIKRYPFAALLFANMILAFNSVLGKIGLETIPTFTYTTSRYLMAGSLMLMMGYFAGQSLVKVKHRDMVIQATLQTVMALSWFYGLSLTQAINSSIIFLLTPIIVYVGSILFLKEPRSNRALSGSLIAFSGGVLMFGAPALGSGTREELLGNGLLLISSASLAAVVLHGKKVITDQNIHTLLGVRFLSAGMGAAVLALLFEQPADITNATTSSLVALLISGTVAGALGLIIFYKALEHMRAEESATLFYIDPLIGTIAATVVLGEMLNDSTLVAAGVIIAGVMISHPVHIHRMIYFQKTSHSKFEEFMHWAKTEYQEISDLVKKYF